MFNFAVRIILACFHLWFKSALEIISMISYLVQGVAGIYCLFFALIQILARPALSQCKTMIGWDIRVCKP